MLFRGLEVDLIHKKNCVHKFTTLAKLRDNS